jgi:hypothetical protein
VLYIIFQSLETPFKSPYICSAGPTSRFFYGRILLGWGMRVMGSLGSLRALFNEPKINNNRLNDIF